MKIKLFQVDAFASNVFEGNPAAVCPLDEWLEDELLQKIAEENNLSETAFFVQSNNHIHLRWFTPQAEVDLCGHATLAAAHVLYQHLAFIESVIRFQTRSGELLVAKSKHGYTMDFPINMPINIEAPSLLLAGLGIEPLDILVADDYLVVLNSEHDVKNIRPDFSKWAELDKRGVIVSAKSEQQDFVSRCFFPRLGVNEDPVTGSAHCQLVPYWAKQLGKTTLLARQISARSGLVNCELLKDRVLLTGHAVDYMQGVINLPNLSGDSLK
ncbi:PhzF family phenazine biosynthesis protein [Paraglaciecola sp. L3A3]|uniref:PhzF family phenazine biosynthesis protein n=1 Tax=Paraglaciecola sp. L3A3 TaxID=2686358 RepID=UPI00131CA096|nr:PhzF family phenazine biosynthesis protein [Paraglaciecola sp. L3A3]